MCGVFVRKGLGSLWLGSSLQCDSHWVWSTSPAFKTAFKEVAQATSTRQHYPQVILVLPPLAGASRSAGKSTASYNGHKHTAKRCTGTARWGMWQDDTALQSRERSHGLITAFHDINLPWFYCGHDSTSKQEAPKYKHCAENSAPPCAINSLCARFSAATVSIRI